MIVQKESIYSGKVNSMDIPLSESNYMEAYQKWQNGAYIQNAFPMLNVDQREFLMTGTTPEEWNQMFSEEENE